MITWIGNNLYAGQFFFCRCFEYDKFIKFNRISFMSFTILCHGYCWRYYWRGRMLGVETKDTCKFCIFFSYITFMLISFIVSCSFNTVSILYQQVFLKKVRTSEEHIKAMVKLFFVLYRLISCLSTMIVVLDTFRIPWWDYSQGDDHDHHQGYGRLLHSSS